MRCSNRKYSIVYGLKTLVAAATFATPSILEAEDPLWAERVASSPTYRILPRPLPEHQGKYVPYSTTHQPMEKPNIESRATTPYSYGWFGPRATPQWSRHFGYHQSYTQWSLK